MFLAVLPANCRELKSYLSECHFTVNDNDIELGQSFQHPRHIITVQLNDVSDITAKQNAFIGQTNKFIYSIIQEICNKNSDKQLWSKRCTLFGYYRV